MAGEAVTPERPFPDWPNDRKGRIPNSSVFILKVQCLVWRGHSNDRLTGGSSDRTWPPAACQIPLIYSLTKAIMAHFLHMRFKCSV